MVCHFPSRISPKQTPKADIILPVGSNVAETVPPIMHYFERQQASGGLLIVVDPRQSTTAQRADLHLQLTPGTDAALASGILHVLIVEGLVDREYIPDMTVNLELATNTAAAYWPSRAERTTGVPLLIVERANSPRRAHTAKHPTRRSHRRQTPSPKVAAVGPR